MSGNKKKEAELFDHIQKGMSVQEVKAFLGEADQVITDTVNKTHYYYYFKKGKSPLRSRLPTVMFDSTYRVVYAAY